MRKVLSLFAGALGLVAVSATPSSAVTVQFDILSVSNVLALGILPLTVGGFSGSYLTMEFDEFGNGELIDARLFVQGPIMDEFESGANLTLTTLPGEIDLLQIAAGTVYDSDGDTIDDTTAENAVGTLTGTSFVFDIQSFLSVAGAPDTGLATCTGPLCAFLPPVPVDLSGPLAPLDLAPPAVALEILNLIEGQTATMTGTFAFSLGGTSVSFTIDDAQGLVVPEPGTALLLGSGLAGLMAFGRRRLA